MYYLDPSCRLLAWWAIIVQLVRTGPYLAILGTQQQPTPAAPARFALRATSALLQALHQPSVLQVAYRLRE
jgi:hypothetical protein